MLAVFAVALSVLSRVRGLDICAEFGLNSLEERNDNNDNNVVCYNSTDQAHYYVSSLKNSNFLLYPTTSSDSFDKTKICSYSSRRSWSCQSVIFNVENNQLNHVFSKGSQQNRVRRQADNLKLIQPRLPRRNVTYSVLTVGGVDWVCEQLSETQCKPLYPKRTTEDKGEVRGSEGEPQAEYFTDVRLDSLARVVDDDTRWQWSQARRGGGGSNTEQDEARRAYQEDPDRTEGEGNSGGKYVYNINGVTWLCHQLDQLKCFPILNPWDGSSQPPGLSTALPPHIQEEEEEEEEEVPSYPEYSVSTARAELDITADRRVANNWEYLNTLQTTAKPPFKRTTFCSRAIKFIAKDEVVLSFTTFSGLMKMYLRATRRRGRVEMEASMLRPGQEGLGGQQNSPPVFISADVNCDTISLTVEDKLYKIDYGFGRLGVKEMEVLGNLESTGMVPRGGKEKPKLGSVRNFVETEDFSPLLLRASPVSQETADNNIEDSQETADNNIEDSQQEDQRVDFPVTDDNYQIDGQGDVEVSLGESSNTQHRYQISRGQDGEVNIDVVVGDNIPAPDKSVVIDNKDYNYTLIISGQDIQVIHHDTKRNLTYRHGLDESQISQVGVTGELKGTTTSFKETDRTTKTEPSPSPTPRQFPVAKPGKVVSVFGSLCVSACSLATDGRHYCEVGGGGSEECGPGPGTTPEGAHCADQCSRRGDDYFWCQRQDAPWDYCSPPLVFQQDLRCPEDAERSTVPDPSDCARYLSCEAGLVRLEECPEGLHYIHRNRTCEWPTGGGCGDVFGRSASRSSPVSPPPSNQIDDINARILTTIKRIRLPTDSPLTNIQPRVQPQPLTLSTDSQTNRSFPRSLFPGQSDHNNIDQPLDGGVSKALTTTTTELPREEPQDELDINQIIDRSRDFKFGLTSHGELCTDQCSQRGYPYYWCHKQSSSLGQWWDSDFCSPVTNVTHYGKECQDDCGQRGEKYFWCSRKIDGGWGYCSPSTVYRRGDCSQDTKSNKLYAIVGDCERYIQCRAGKPVLSTCNNSLYFDYILLSCTYKKDVRCIGVQEEE